MKNNSLRLAVTGINGQVAQALIQNATEHVEVVALGRPQLDMSMRNSILASLRHLRCDIIINAAAYTQVDKAETESDLVLKINGCGAGHVAEAAAELCIPLIHLSTDYVFDGQNPIPYKETDPTCPKNIYGRSKLMGEENIASIHADHVILRTAWIFSPFGTNFVKTMLRFASEKNLVNVVGDQIGNPTSAFDIADSILVIANKLMNNKDKNLRGIFNLTNIGSTTWAGFADKIFEYYGELSGKNVYVRKILTKDYPTLAPRPLNSQLDNSKIKMFYGIELPHWESSLKRCVDIIMQEKNRL